MNHERFQQRWEFRRREVDGDTSSDDNRSNSSGDPVKSNHMLVTDLVLLENDDAPGYQRPDKLDNYKSGESQTVKADKKKMKSTKKKNVAPKKSEGRTVNEIKRKRKLDTNDVVMFKDLKIFADSLVHELTVVRENMFTHMREEMTKLGASRSNLEPVKKNVKCFQKKVSQQNGIKASMKPHNCFGGSTHTNVGSNEAAKHDQPRELITKNELHKGDRLRLSAMLHMNLAYGSDQAVSSSHFPLHTVLPKLKFQNQSNGIHSNNHIREPINNSGSERDIQKWMAAKRFSHQIAEFQPEERSFSHSCHETVGLLGQNSSQTTIRDIGFPVPLYQLMDNGSNTSSLTYCENSFMDNNGIGLRMNDSISRFPGKSPASSVRVIPDSIISKLPHHNTNR